MDETIDLRPYVDALVRRWWVILGAVIAGILIAAYLHFSATNYRATALLAAFDPSQRLQFDERIFSAVDLDSFTSAYPELATSDDALAPVLARAEELTNGDIATKTDLRNILRVETGSDSRLLRLSVSHSDPEVAAELANIWAESFVSTVDDVYLGRAGQIEFFEGLFADANAELQSTGQALVEFQSGTRMGIVDNELMSLNQQQSTYLADRRRLTILLEDAESLSALIEAGPGDTITYADQLAALTLQQSVFIHETPILTPTIGITQSTYGTIQLQADPQFDLTTSDRSEQLALLENLAETIETSLAGIDVKLLELESRFFELQREKQAMINQYEELVRRHDVGVETTVTLARKIDEVRIQTQDSGSSLRIASLASPPVEYDRSSPILSAMTAGLLGFLVSVVAIILYTWWRPPGERAAD